MGETVLETTSCAPRNEYITDAREKQNLQVDPLYPKDVICQVTSILLTVRDPYIQHQP